MLDHDSTSCGESEPDSIFGKDTWVLRRVDAATVIGHHCVPVAAEAARSVASPPAVGVVSA